MCVMHPIVITFRDPGPYRAQAAPNATFTPFQLLARGSWLPMPPLSITRPAITNFWMLGSADPSLFDIPTFMSSVHAILLASPYFFYFV